MKRGIIPNPHPGLPRALLIPVVTAVAVLAASAALPACAGSGPDAAVERGAVTHVRITAAEVDALAPGATLAVDIGAPRVLYHFELSPLRPIDFARVALVSAAGTRGAMDQAVEALRHGAFDPLETPDHRFLLTGDPSSFTELGAAAIDELRATGRWVRRGSGGAPGATPQSQDDCVETTYYLETTTVIDGHSFTFWTAHTVLDCGDTEPCTPGATISCYSGPPGTEGVGICAAGRQTCRADGSGHGPCAGQVLPAPESCATPEDDDCNGDSDAGACASFVGVAAGNGHSLGLRGDGTVWSWGYNSYGQLGDGTVEMRVTPVQVLHLDGVISLSACYLHTLATRADGTVAAWGGNDQGELGDGTHVERHEPVAVSGVTDAVAVAAGEEYSLVLHADGTVSSWGANDQGQLGDGTTAPHDTPARVSGLTGVTALAAGAGHSLALRDDGTVWSWGRNTYGELGTGAGPARSLPGPIPGLGGVVAIATYGWHSLALRADGTVWSWGSNGDGELGDGTRTSRATPTQVLGLTGVSAIAAGGRHSLALLGDGTVWAWGDNGLGQLGDGTDVRRTAPVQVAGLTGATAVTAGAAHALALRADATMWGWGWNELGLLGDGTVDTTYVPVEVRLP